jgi:uncharacterized protein (DUF1697 family)
VSTAEEASLSPAQRSIAFLRAINVGGHTVKMDRLRTLFEELGYANVATYIASGNVIFEMPRMSTQTLEAQIEHHLQQALGYEVITFVRTIPELAAIVADAPVLPTSQKVHGLYVAFLKAPLDAETQAKLLALNSETDEFHVHGSEFYWLCRIRLSDSPLFSGTLLTKTVGVPMTLRSVTTVKKLAAKYAEGAA